VVSDRITGNPLEEADTVGAVGPRKPEYTGSPPLVRAFRPLTGIQKVTERPISEPRSEESQGAFVEFFTDGNLHLTVNSRKIFELAETEQSDKHDAYIMDRLSAIATEPSAHYGNSAFQGTGFLVGTDRSVFAFSHGTLNALALKEGGLHALAQRLIDPARVQVLSGLQDPVELVRTAKWMLRRALLGVRPAGLALTYPGDVKSRSSRLARLIRVFREAGLPVETVDTPSDGDEMDALIPGGSRDSVTLKVSSRSDWPEARTIPLPEGLAWRADRPAPLVAGVPYRIVESPSEISDESDFDDPAELGRERSDAYGRLMALLSDWNEGTLSADQSEPEAFTRAAQELLSACPAPVVGELFTTDEGYTVRFLVQHGFTLGRARENTQAVRRIQTISGESAPEDLFRSERRRLLELLDELLSTRRATVRPPAETEETKPAEKKPKPEPEKKAAAGTQGAARNEPAAASSDTKSGQIAAGAPSAPASTRSSKRRAVPFAIAGVVVVAGAVALVLWMGTGEGASLVRDSESSVVQAEPVENTPEAADTVTNEQPQNDTEDPGATDRSDPSDTDETADQAANPENSSGSGGNPTASVEVEVSISDIRGVVNEIARRSGYAPLGPPVPGERSPDWIFPGNELVLPTGARYVVQSGDTMWGIAETFLRETAQEHHTILTNIRQRMETGERPVDELEAIVQGAYLESTRRRARQLMSELGV
jgi:hypothetical protein